MWNIEMLYLKREINLLKNFKNKFTWTGKYCKFSSEYVNSYSPNITGSRSFSLNNPCSSKSILKNIILDTQKRDYSTYPNIELSGRT